MPFELHRYRTADVDGVPSENLSGEDARSSECINSTGKRNPTERIDLTPAQGVTGKRNQSVKMNCATGR
jgi:hypothetical protein